ncbi:hypothetical protein [Halobellus sp. Atlit-38R]|uniref:hypothetical protein n=1 Tax=Halobellus sp. Atlit-38R TaxID=2282131 RepID=UPI0011C472A8|nr:hypothetical protein [Halobellus sp. Atlit-38R]
MDIVAFIGVFSMAGVSSISPGVPDVFYLIAFLMTLLFVFRICYTPSKIVIIQILLFSIVLRAAIFFSAPVIGKDTRFHIGATRYILDTGFVISDPRYYYRFFPIAHILSAVVGNITNFNPSRSFFFGVSIPTTTITILAVFAYSKRIASNNGFQTALFAGLLIAIIPSHVARSGVPIAQTLSLAMISLLLLAIVVNRGWQIKFVLFLFIVVSTLTHNASLIIFGFFGLLLLLFNILGDLGNKIYGSDLDTISIISFSLPILAVTVISTITYWRMIDYFSLQVGRIRIIALGETSAVTQISNSSISGAAYSFADPILHLGIELFITVIGLIFSILWAIKKIIHFGFESVPIGWLGASLILFTTIGLSIAAGGTDRTFRLLPAVALIISPIIAITLEELGSRKVGVILVTIIIIMSPTLAVVAAENNLRNNWTPPTNRSPEDAQAHFKSSEKAGLDFALEYADDIRTGPYAYGVALFENLNRPPSIISDPVSRENLTTTRLSKCGSLTLYRTVYAMQEIERPQGNIVYDSEGAILIRCV